MIKSSVVQCAQMAPHRCRPRFLCVCMRPKLALHFKAQHIPLYVLWQLCAALQSSRCYLSQPVLILQFDAALPIVTVSGLGALLNAGIVGQENVMSPSQLSHRHIAASLDRSPSSECIAHIHHTEVSESRSPTVLRHAVRACVHA